MTNLVTELEVKKQQEIGQDGANSKVFKVYDVQLNATLALKEVEVKDFTNLDHYLEEARMLNEARHNHVVDIKFASKDSQNIYMAMPFYKNGSLKNLIDARFLSVREIIKIATDFLSGLHHIHVKGLIHFDIKPSNILFDDANKALIADFGLSGYYNNQGIALQNMVYGKHIVPEFNFGSHRAITSDIYQAGLVLYRMCNGDFDFEAEWDDIVQKHNGNVQNIFSEIQKGKFPSRKYKRHIPLSLRKIINKAIDIDPNKRHKTSLELLNDLANVSGRLDWCYTESSSLPKWTRTTDKNGYIVEVTQDKGSFSLSVKKMTLATNRLTNDNVNTKKGFTSIEKACIHAEKVLNTLNDKP